MRLVKAKRRTMTNKSGYSPLFSRLNPEIAYNLRMQLIPQTNTYAIWSVLCHSATVDTTTNDLSLNKIIEGLVLGFEHVDALSAFSTASQEKPTVLPLQAELVTLWKKKERTKPAHIDARVTYRDPNGKELQSMEFPITMDDAGFRHRHRLAIPSLAVTVPGEYHFVIEAKGKTEKTYTLVTELPIDIDFKIEAKKA